MMIRFLLIIIVSVIAIIPSGAQQWSGQWKIYPIVGTNYSRVLDTPSKVYFLNSGALYSYDKNSHETYFYNTSNKLSGSSIKEIYYNTDGKFLVIVYADSNIDLLYDNGNSYCLPDIRDANITGDKTVNDVAFGKDYMAVATNFGLVLYDTRQHEVKQSGIYNEIVKTVAICGDYLVIATPSGIWFSKLGDRINSLKAFTFVADHNVKQMIDINNTDIAWIDGKSFFYAASTIDFANASISDRRTGVKVLDRIEKCEGGYYMPYLQSIWIYGNDSYKTGEFTLPDAFTGYKVGMCKDKSSVWLAGAQGTANFDMSSSTPTVLSDWYRPESASCNVVVYFYKSADGDRIYVGNLGPTINRKYIPTFLNDADGIRVRQTTDLIENGTIRDVSLAEASASVSDVQRAQASAGNKGMYGGVTRLVEDPADKSRYFIGNGLEGLYVVKDGKEEWKWNINNAPFHTYWGTRVFDVNFDPQGNMWVGHAHSTSDLPPYIVLPAAKLRKGFDKVTKDDWVWPQMSNYNAMSKDFMSMFCKKSNYAFFTNARGFEGFYMLDTKGTYDNFKDDKCYNIIRLTDQDGNSLNPEYFFTFVEDALGRVWIGTSQGVYYFNASSGLDENSTVIRPKVPRNDGTNYADFLLDSDQINCIAIDPSDRKWIATDYSGLYLVSPNGDKIIKHFDSSNSPLPTNRVTAVECDNNSNTVYVGTTEGLFSFKSDSSPAKEDFSEVYAFPNPVRPDYTGWITIAGLMDGSLVKITDSAGNVFYQGKSEGGMLAWDGCNSAGDRVRSGIYYVYVSAGGDGQNSSGAVTKIMVIN